MNYANSTIILSKSELSALLAFASTDATRTHLCGVALDPSGILFATDGHRLLAWQCPELTAHRAVMSREDLAKVVKAAGVKDTIQLALHADHATAWIGSANFRIAFSDLKPPPCREVIPDYSGITPSESGLTGLNADYLADLAKVTKAIAGKSGGVRLHHGPDCLSPLLVTFADDDQWLAVIMPMRVDAAPQVRAKPLALPPAAAAAAA